MTNDKQTGQEAQSTTTQPTIEELIQPLLVCLKKKYSTGDLEDYQVQFVDRFGDDFENQDRVLLELPDNIVEHERALAAVTTILRATGSERVWGYGESPEGGPLEAPLRISYMKRAAWAGYFMAWTRYLLIDDGGAEFDAEKAALQIAGLVSLISDESNLVKLSDEDRGLF